MNTRTDLDLAHRLIRHAAHKAPPALAARLEEEWLADLESRQETLSRLRLAAGCYWATAVITHEFTVPRLAPSVAGSGSKYLSGDLPFNLPLLSRRTVAFIAIAGVHVLIIYGFASGLAQHVLTSFQPVTEAEVIENVRHPHEVAPKRDFTPSFIPAHFDLDKFQPDHLDLRYAPESDVDVNPAPTSTGGSPVPPAVVRTPGGPGAGFPDTDDFYPPLSRRLAQTGAATVQVCVDARGRLTAAPALVRSSGIARLDAGALNLATAGSGHYRPSSENGTPISSCYAYRIRFDLK